MKKVSILMGIYNCEDTLKEAVKSIQAQTYANWELIICDDGSSDRSFSIARELEKTDKRIIVLANKRNEGLNYTLNHCLAQASGEYVARMDGDDISLPDRFEKEVSFLEENADYAIVSTPMIFFDNNGEWGRGKAIQFPTAEDIISGSPICHAPVMMRKECMDKVGGYTVDKRMLRVEDVNLWIKLYAAGYRCCNLQEPLYCMRNDQNALNRRKYKYRVNSTYVRLKGCKMLGLGSKYYLKSFKPMINGLVPASLRAKIRHKQYRESLETE